MDYYSYEGPVLMFGKPVINYWKGDTYAPSSRKAVCNLAHQFKMKFCYALGAKVELPGKLEKEE